MNLHSFRLKIALLSGLITGLLLVGLGVVLWQFTYQFNLERLDREIRNLGQSNLQRVMGDDHWSRLESALKFVSGDKLPASYIIWVKNYDRVTYQSPEWPKDIQPESFQVPAEYEMPDAPKAGQPPPRPPRRGEEISPQNPALPRKKAQFHSCQAGGKNWRIGVMGNPYVALLLGADIDDFNRRMIELRNNYLAILPVVLLLVAGGAWLVAWWALRPVTTLTQTAERVTARGLDQRIPTMPRDEEFNRLITVFNEMMARLETSFSQATRFSADASHELKTPLGHLQVELEQALESSPDGSPQQEVYSSLLDEIHHLKAIIQKLLLLSLADAGRLQIHRESVNLTRMLGNIIEDCQAQAPHLTTEHELVPNIHVKADPDLLEQALQNLATNAIKYNCENGRIRFDLRLENQHPIIRIGNTGPGISASDRERVFERFYRADPSRSGRVEGVGLGLSLAREIVRAHQGELVLEPAQAGWTTFAIRLPVADGG
jgi:signal transduction histidine kinase